MVEYINKGFPRTGTRSCCGVRGALSQERGDKDGGAQRDGDNDFGNGGGGLDARGSMEDGRRQKWWLSG